MAKSLKLRIYKAIATTLESCRSKDPSILPQDHHFSSVGPSGPHPLQYLKWQKDEKWHVIANIHNSGTDDLTFSPSVDKNRRSRKKKKKKSKNIPSRLRLSTSSADSGWFTSAEIEGEETETLVSSPEFSFQPAVRETRRNKVRRPVSRKTSAPEVEAPARLSMFKKLIPCTVEGKVKESFAVVKRSDDPYEDFKNSMMDMILEKQMFDPDDLEQLLQCFLSLNSRHYHGIIVQAFSQILEAFFYPYPARPGTNL